jgi:hypothetical protein
MAGPLDPTSLHDAVRTLLSTEAEGIPDHHGFVAMVDLHTGAHLGVATRLGDGWSFTADGGYNWEHDKGWNGRVAIGKTWS